MIQLPPKVSRGDQITASWANKVVEAIAALRPMAGAGTRISQNPGGFIISASQSAAPVSNFPFQCTLVNSAGTDGSPATIKVRVELNSYVRNYSPWQDIPITGLFNPDATSTGYPVEHLLNDPDYVILDLAFDTSGGVTSAAITTQGAGSTVDPTLAAWDSSGNALFAADSSTPPFQTAGRLVIAEYASGTLTQVVNQNLYLYDMVVDGQLARYPRPAY